MNSKRKNPNPSFFSGYRRSISHDLTGSLVVCILVIATAMGGYIYWQQTEDMWQIAEEKGEATITSVTKILAVPIWDLDYDNARLISSVYTQDEMVQGIRIYGFQNEVVFAHEKTTGGQADFSKVRSILFKGKTIGRAEIDFTLARDKKHLKKQMVLSSMMIATAIAVIVAVTGLLLRIFLNKPLHVLQQGIARVSKGDFSYDFGEVHHAELLEIAKRFQRMCSEVEAREKKLQTMNTVLQKAEEKYRGIFENAIEGLFQLTPNGELRRANPAMARIFGYDSRDEFLSDIQLLGVRGMINPDAMRDFGRQVREHGEVVCFETQCYRRDGETFWAALNARAIYGESRELLLIEGFLADITERKKVEQDLANLNRHLEQLVRDRTEDLVNKAHELEEANQRLRELDEMKSEFLSSVSHELRTPLTSILGFSKLLNKDFARSFLPLAGEDGPLLRRGERIQENLDIISHEGERLTRLVNDVLDLNKIESGQMGWHDQSISLADAIDLAVRTVAGTFAQNPEVDVTMEIDPNLPVMTVDPDRIQQVLINLLNNAAKFTTKGTVTVRAFLRFKQVRVEVADTGLGISHEDQAQIFEKFHQIHSNTLGNKPEGTGLGLAICREIIEHYGGRIWAESEPGQGATFIFTLPLLDLPRRAGSR